MSKPSIPAPPAEGSRPISFSRNPFFLQPRGQSRRPGPENLLSFPQVLLHFCLMGKRREARERAVQFLFQHDLNPPENLDEALNLFWESQRSEVLEREKGKATWGEKAEPTPLSAADAEVRLFAEPLIRGALEHRAECDEHIMRHCKNWELHRIAAVDRNVMRLAVYEMLHRQDIPPVVSINEAVDIAKRFSTNESGKFVNGILDKIKSDLMRPARDVK
jgi:N utilization substance protein B